VSKLKRLLCYESQHQSQSNEKSLVQFDYEKAVSNYLGTQSTFNPARRHEDVSTGAEQTEEKKTKKKKRLTYMFTFTTPAGLKLAA